MKCRVCGQDYGVAHQCAGVAPGADVSDVSAPPKGFALGHYLGEALRIATWNDDAIRRTMNDPNAIVYGVIIYMAAVSLQLAVPVLRLLAAGRVEHAVIVASSVAILLLAAVGLDFLKIGICHFFQNGSRVVPENSLNCWVRYSSVRLFTPSPYLRFWERF